MIRRRDLPPIAIGIVMSVISSRFLFVGSGLSLIPWGIIAIALGVAASSRRDAARLGAFYGFTQAFCFLWIDKSGSTTWGQLILLIVITLALSVAAAACAALAAVIALGGKHRLGHSRGPYRAEASK